MYIQRVGLCVWIDIRLYLLITCILEVTVYLYTYAYSIYISFLIIVGTEPCMIPQNIHGILNKTPNACVFVCSCAGERKRKCMRARRRILQAFLRAWTERFIVPLDCEPMTFTAKLYEYTQMRECTYTRVCVCQMHVCMYTRVRVCMCMCMSMCTYMYVYIYACVRACVLVVSR